MPYVLPNVVIYLENLVFKNGYVKKSSQIKFKYCPTCLMIVDDNDCHPIYDFPKELLEISLADNEDEFDSEDDAMRQYLQGILKEKLCYNEKVIG
uniref:Phage protein n=1 Tax=Strongyloides papillosus TaxID=174720 RepID=A0A0N5BCC2_STREA